MAKDIRLLGESLANLLAERTGPSHGVAGEATLSAVAP